MIKLKFGFGVVLAVVALVITCCYDATKLPPCTGGEEWPDPCAAAPRDAGRG